MRGKCALDRTENQTSYCPCVDKEQVVYDKTANYIHVAKSYVYGSNVYAYTTPGRYGYVPGSTIIQYLCMRQRKFYNNYVQVACNMHV